MRKIDETEITVIIHKKNFNNVMSAIRTYCLQNNIEYSWRFKEKMPDEFGFSLYIEKKCSKCKQKLSIIETDLKEKITCGLCGYYGLLSD